MGPSGSGKSTLLAVLSGLLLDSGKVLSLGVDVWSLPEKQQEAFRLRHVGFIFQGYNLFPALTARQQLEMVLRWGQGASAREARRRSEEMLALLGLARKAHLRPAEMSGGEKQRVAIGRALMKNPDFCFADEPTSALDWARGEQVIELLRAAAHGAAPPSWWWPTMPASSRMPTVSSTWRTGFCERRTSRSAGPERRATLNGGPL